MESPTIYISQEDPAADLIQELNRSSLVDLQRLSAEVWTDYNIHDPGVTIIETLNYALSELDYKLGFPLFDYLAPEQGTFSTQEYGLFMPREIYPNSPITINDYRKLFMAQFSEIENISIETVPATNLYDIFIELSPFEPYNAGIERQVEMFYHQNRNLNENLRKVEIAAYRELYLHAELEISPETDPTTTIATIYYTAGRYLSGNLQFERLSQTDFSLDEWFDGPGDAYTRVRVPEQRNTHTELFAKLSKIDGIRSFKTCYLLNRDGVVVNQFDQRYTLFIPRSTDQLCLKINIDGSPTYIEIDRCIEELRALYFSQTAVYRQSSIECDGFHYGEYRDLYHHYNVDNDLPSYYGLGVNGLVKSASNDRKAHAKQLQAYLRIADTLFRRSLSELKGIRELMSLNWSNENQPLIDDQDMTRLKNLSPKISHRKIDELQNRYMDFLDDLYATDTHPDWMEEYCYDDLSGQNLLAWRAEFLRAMPQLIRDRAQSFNIYGPLDGENIPIIKRYLSILLQMNTDEGSAVVNLLPSHNLSLVPSMEYRQTVNSSMIDDSIFRSQNLRSIIYQDVIFDDFEELRRDLSIFHNNTIGSDLFRNGIYLENYRLAILGKERYLLVFRSQNDRQWISIARASDADQLNRLANSLRRYLTFLNHGSEVVYVLEHSLFSDSKSSAEVSIVFSNWSFRCKSPRFRAICHRLIEQLLPAHLVAKIYWLNIPEMQIFESAYQKWRQTLTDKRKLADQQQAQNQITELFKTMTK